MIIVASERTELIPGLHLMDDSAECTAGLSLFGSREGGFTTESTESTEDF